MVYDSFRVLAGRQYELEEMLEAWQQCREGASPCIVVSGETGVGKTALLHRYRQLLRGQARLVSVSCGLADGANGPYAPLLTALRMLLRQLLTTEERVLRLYRRRLRRSVGAYARPLAVLLPELGQALGGHDQVPRSSLPPGADARRELETMLLRLLRVLCDGPAPVVLCFDDWHLVDPALRQLIERLEVATRPPSLLLIMVCTSGKEESESPVRGGAEIPARGKAMQLRVEALSHEAVRSWITELGGLAGDEAERMASLLYRWSGGHPGTIASWLFSHMETGLLRYTETGALWESVETMLDSLKPLAPRLVHPTDRLERLPKALQERLGVLSLLGEEPELSLAAAVTGLPEHTLRQELQLAADQGLLVRCPGAGVERWRIPDEAVRAAAQAKLDKEIRLCMHSRAGNWLLRHAPDHRRGENLPELLRHFNRCIGTQMEHNRTELAELNHRAAQEAIASCDYETSLFYTSIAEQLLQSEGKREAHFKISLMRLGLEYLAGAPGRAETYAAELESAARDAGERARIFIVQSKQHAYANRRKEAVDKGIMLLGQLGVEIPRTPSADRLLAELRTAAGFMDEPGLPERGDVTNETIIDLLMATAAAAGFADYRLLGFLLSEAIRRGGRNYGTVEAYAGLAGMMLWTAGDGKQAIVFAKQAVEMADAQEDMHIRANVYGAVFPLYARLLSPRERGRFLRQAAQSTTATGLLHAHTVLSGMQACSYYLAGNLRRLERYLRWRKVQEADRQGGREDPYLTAALDLYVEFVERLRYGASASGRYYTLEGPPPGQRGLPPGNCNLTEHALLYGQFAAMQVQLLVLQGHPERALQWAAACREAVAEVTVLPHHPEYWLYTGLAATSIADVAWLEEALAQLSVWAELAPDNYGYKYNLLLGDEACMKGDRELAVILYEKAMRASRLQRNGLLSALAGERAAALHRQADRCMGAALLSAAAWQSAQRTGALMLADRLEREWSSLWQESGIELPRARWSRDTPVLKSMGDEGAGVAAAGVSIMNRTDNYNLFTGTVDVSSSATSLSWRQLLTAVAEGAAASAAALLLRQEDTLRIAARWLPGKCTACWENAFGEGSGPGSLFRMVERTGEPILLMDEAAFGVFGTDSYLRQHSLQGLAVLPIHDLGRPIGYLYLEYGDKQLSPALILPDEWGLQMAKALRERSAERAHRHEADQVTEGLTVREREVLGLAAKGWSNKELAEQLQLAEGTVKIHLHRIYEKLGVRRRTQAIERARQLGLL
ncbi:helix-turn-helix transcriptional regulator [Paenibacillus daejeonensis]|uniref:helix-turn-helix transcriptional regulator n=1 Tax=Paenibacillus daejeonensis TaxID=135193 RepID=UPI0003695089|nr:helix-turn-helix transcriptional regulator [Paenibacillus daejeonensis]